MPIYSNTSCKTVIAKLYRDLDLEDPNYEYDFIEWMGEALSFIGSALQFETKESEIAISSFKGLIPTGLVIIKQLQYKDESQDCWKLIKYNPRNFKMHEDDCPNLEVNTEESFTLNPNYIETSFEEGTVRLSYRAVATDDDGYPLVPDNQYFKTALFWYCYRQMILRGYKPRVPELTYTFADQKWQFYCSGARNKANYPDISGYERFLEIWVGLLPKDYLLDTGFDTKKVQRINPEIVTASNLVTTPITIDSEDE